jgi:hypothetical protein
VAGSHRTPQLAVDAKYIIDISVVLI